ncbi:hypothetical protein E5134_10570 [Pasteurella multocida]|uniref:DUF1281 family ferredoxin-like fold protein n=1 Tax=Pasteurella multocida TaxID=747 RepID=UPI0010933884|nr:hypothetical protein [Pasteurella multocida]QCA34422.1 hypothetical protein E5134_10570 [Pasteurella multocida]HDX1167836.1 hypothetical protein [Pasteurella multocida]
MPNWCENRLSVTATNAMMMKAIAEKVLRFDQEENQQVVDFNLLIPMPKEVNIVCGSYGWRTLQLLELDKGLLLTDDLIDEFVKDSKKALRLSLLSKEHNWTVGDFVHWLKDNSNEPDYFYFDLVLGQQYIDNKLKYNAPTWYEWAYENWGVKWNADTQYCDDICEGQTYFCVDFDTAWCPPSEWFTELTHQFPEASFRLTYFEPGMLFAGVQSSTETENCHYEYPDSVEEVFNIAIEFGYSKDDFEFKRE